MATPIHSLVYTEHRYGTDNFLQNIGVWTFPDSSPDETRAESTKDGGKYWLIYIHGGAWRDPRCLMDTFSPSISRILAPSSPLPASRIAGFATINYRLSPHLEFPPDQDHAIAKASSTTTTNNNDSDPDTREKPAGYTARTARHPDHIRDVRSALAYLRALGIGIDDGTYVLAGHSCGATLAYQVLMGASAAGSAAATVPLPAAVVGFQGIYDLGALNARCAGALQSIASGTFGSDDEAVWDAAAPAKWRGGWPIGPGGACRLAVVAHSPQDELVDMAECDAMSDALRKGGVQPLVFRDLEGAHDEVREDGRYVARVLGQTVEELDRLRRGAR